MADLDPAVRADLEAQLVQLGRSLQLPPTPDLPQAVLRRLAQPPTRPAHPARPRTRRRVAIVAIVVLGLLGALTPPGQAAVARVVHAFGVALHIASPTAPARPEQLPGETGTALERARRQVRFDVVVPARLGPPDQVTVSDGGRVLSLIYTAAPGRPTPGPGGVSGRLDEFDGSIDTVFLKQLSAAAEWLQLPDDTPAIWISAPHDVVYLDRDGHPRTEAAHLAGHTLIWSVGAVTLRLEGGYTREQALAIATG